MKITTIYEFAVEVQLMRSLQNKYFKAKGVAARKRTPADFELAASVLLECKLQEKKVDELVQNIVNAGPDVEVKL
jgi:hypothetical protein